MIYIYTGADVEIELQEDKGGLPANVMCIKIIRLLGSLWFDYINSLISGFYAFWMATDVGKFSQT